MTSWTEIRLMILAEAIRWAEEAPAARDVKVEQCDDGHLVVKLCNVDLLRRDGLESDCEWAEVVVAYDGREPAWRALTPEKVRARFHHPFGGLS